MAGIPNIAAYRMPLRRELPSNTANWKIEPKQAILLMHDMQKFFLQPIPIHSTRTELIENCMLVHQHCIAAGIQIAYTQQPGSMTVSQRGLLKDFWGDGMKAEPHDREIIEQLTPNSRHDWLFTKWRYSAFYQSDLLQKMQDAGCDQLIICGVYAHIGILATAIEAFSNNIKVFIVADAIADFSKEKHLMALNYASECCAVVIPTNEVLNDIIIK